MSRRYEVIGVPLNRAPEIPDGVTVGDQIELDLDKNTEKALVGSGVIRPVGSKKGKS